MLRHSQPRARCRPQTPNEHASDTRIASIDETPPSILQGRPLGAENSFSYGRPIPCLSLLAPEREAEAVPEGDAAEPRAVGKQVLVGTKPFGGMPRRRPVRPVPPVRGLHRDPGSAQFDERPDARQELVRIGEGVGVQGHDGGLLIDDPHDAALLGRIARSMALPQALPGLLSGL